MGRFRTRQVGNEGRKPKPTHLRLLEGNPGHRKVTEPARVGAVGAPRMPRQLPAEAKAVWKALVPGLEQVGALRRVDAFSLEALCVQVAIARRASAELEHTGLLAEGSRGQAVENPVAEVLREAQGEIRAWASHFGLDLQSRARLGLETTRKATNELRSNTYA